jgi:hypothetical protein
VEIDIGAAYDTMIVVAASAPTVNKGMEALLDYCAQVCPSEVWEDLRSLDYEADVVALRSWLEHTLTEEPPSPNVKAFWFGLYQAEDEAGPIYVLYLSGSAEVYTPDSLDWACETEESYLPEARYADSRILKTVFRAVQAEPEAVLLAEYMLCMGYACLAIPAIFQSLAPELVLGQAESRTVVTGFDEGDNVLLGQVGKAGWLKSLPAPIVL